MPNSIDLVYDVASAISLGQREVQEDAIICDFPIGAPFGFAVLSDGMGGHAAGDIASKIVVTEVFAELKLQSGNPEAMENGIVTILQGAATSANDCIRVHAGNDKTTRGMGATLVAPVLMADRLYWVSIGDSPLFLFRDGTLKQLNQDHSMAPQIDFLARVGMIKTDAATSHPDRHCLTSVLAGHDIARIDCPETAVKMHHGDIVIAASDGLQFLENSKISEVLTELAFATSAEISTALLCALEQLGDPDQDNVSFCVIKVLDTAEPARKATDSDNVTILDTSGKADLSEIYRASSDRRA
ncbi:MAG: protein phosphatase 2C domain-containing protein [Rhodobacteraceae bacterium]|nr:protein phosphatase 2C domain-containing protein [Paracoccaceae bacterium]